MASRDVLSILMFCLGFLDVFLELGEIRKTPNWNAHFHWHFNEHVNLGFEWPPEMWLFLVFFSFFVRLLFKTRFFSYFFRLLFQTRFFVHVPKGRWWTLLLKKSSRHASNLDAVLFLVFGSWTCRQPTSEMPIPRQRNGILTGSFGGNDFWWFHCGCGEYHGKLKKILEKWIGYMEFRMNSGILGWWSKCFNWFLLRDQGNGTHSFIMFYWCHGCFDSQLPWCLQHLNLA